MTKQHLTVSKKTTKRALWMNVLSLVLCFTMLVSTTFAWFTDSVTSGENQIIAGNLDVEVYYAKESDVEGNAIADNAWKDLQNSEDLFTGALWEPGHTEVVYLKIVNKGTLALNYKMNVTPISESGGINQAGQNFKLSDYLVFGTTEGSTALTTYESSDAGRDAARAAAGTTQKLNQNALSKTGVLYGTGDTDTTHAQEHYLALVVYMPEEVGNVANYKTGTEAPKITLGVTVYATQEDEEKDSFGKDYDANADLTPDNKGADAIDYDYAPQVSQTGQLIIDNENKVAKGDETDTLITAAANANNANQTDVVMKSSVQVDDQPAAQVEMTVEPKDSSDDEKTGSVVLNVYKDDTANGNFITENASDAEGKETVTYEVNVTMNGNVKLVTDGLYKVTMYVGKDRKDLVLFHKAAGAATASQMIKDSEATAEHYSYDPNTGFVVMYVSTFSPFTAAYTAPKNDEYLSAEDAVCRINGEDTVYKIDETNTTELMVVQACINAAQNGQTVKLLKDVSFVLGPTTEYFEEAAALTIPGNKNLTFDLNGHTINVTADENSQPEPRLVGIKVPATATLSLISSAGTPGVITSADMWCGVDNAGTINAIRNITVKATKTVCASSDHWQSAVWNSKGATITTIENSTLTLDGEGADEIDVLTNYGTIGTIDNSTISVHQASTLTYKYAVTNCGTITKIANSTLSIASDLNSESHQQNFTLYNSGTIGELDAVKIDGLMTAISNSGTINKFESASNTVTGDVSGGGTYNIKGGTFSKELKQTYLAAEYMCVSDGNGNYTVKQDKASYDALPKGAAIGDNQYLNFAQALAAAESGDTIKLLADVTEQLVIGKSITLDLNGHNIVPTNASKGTAVRVNNATVTLTDSSENPGSIGTTGTNDWWHTLMIGGVNTNLTIEKIKIYSGSCSGMYFIAGTNNAVVNFKSGELISNTSPSYGLLHMGKTNAVCNVSNTAKIIANNGNAVVLDIASYSAETKPTFNMNGGTIEVTGSGYGIYNQSADYGIINLKDATITTKSGYALYVGGITIDHCTITTTSSYALYLKHDGYDRSYNTCVATIKGDSTVNGGFIAQNAAKWTITMENGTYKFDPSKYVSGDYLTTKSNNVWTVAKHEHNWYVKSIVKDETPNTEIAEETATITYACDGCSKTKTEQVRYLTVKNVGSQTDNTTFDLYCGQTLVKENATFSNCANADETWLGRNVVKFPAGSFYDTGDTYLNSSAFFMIGEKDSDGSPLTKYIPNGSGCVSYKGLQLQNRATNTPDRTFYFENVEFDGSNQQNKWGHLITMTCYGIDAEFVNVKFSHLTQTSRTSVIGVWANDTRENGSYPTKAENVGVDVRFTNCSVADCGSKPVMQFQSFTSATIEANSDCYSYISVVADASSITAMGFGAENAFTTQSGNNIHDGLHTDWYYNGNVVAVPGETK